MKKTFLFLSMLGICCLFLAGCASNSGVEAQKKLIVPQIAKVLVKDTDANPLVKTNVKGILVMHPYDVYTWAMESQPGYEMVICDKKTGEELYTVENVINNWQGLQGWNGQIVPEDYTFFTKDYVQYVVKADYYTCHAVIEDGYGTAFMDNPLMDTDLPFVYTILPSLSNKKLIESGETHTVEIIDKTTGEVVRSFDNVVAAWSGMNGWNGKVLKEDYTFVTTDKKQYIVKARKYDFNAEQ